MHTEFNSENLKGRQEQIYTNVSNNLHVNKLPNTFQSHSAIFFIYVIFKFLQKTWVECTILRVSSNFIGKIKQSI
jgi:hypothetical protein